MTQSPSVSLETFIYRTLTTRLAIMAIAIGLVITAIVYLVERQNLRSLVIEETRTEIQLLLTKTMQLTKEFGIDRRAAFRQALEERLSIRIRRENGEFVYACFYENNNPDSEERLDADYALIGPVVQYVRSHPPPDQITGDWAEIVMIGGKPHVHIVQAIEAPSLQKKVYARVFFAPSEAVLIGIQKKLKRSAVLAIVIVLATSGLLYPVILHLVGKLTLFSRTLLDANLETLSLLASAIAKRDSDTDMHNFRVTLYSIRLAEALRLPETTIQTLIKGAFLHDVGKIGVRDSILLKPGGLDEEEFSLMKDHVQHGLDIISGSHWLRDAALVVGSHHEKFDGSGYPHGTVGEEIPLLARIFAVADVFDALTSRRPYKEPLSYPVALSVLRQGRGSHFDPTIVDAFTDIAQELYQACSGADDQGVRDQLKAVITRYFSKGEMVLY